MLKWICTVTAVAVPATAVLAANFDAPDIALEAELHRQFVQQQQKAPAATASIAPVEGVPPSLAKDAYVESYDIQKGETLWSLSRTLYGDGNYWPRVWAQNNSITNPHLIRPGHTLQFLMGSEDDTPAFRFTEEGENEGVELAAASSNPVIEIPPPEISPRPVLRLPPSFPEWQQVFKRIEMPPVDDRSLNKKRDEIADRIYLRAWVEEQDIDPIGYFMENDTESGLPVVNQFVFIKLKRGSGHPGMKLLIAHSAGPLRKVQELFQNMQEAWLIQVAGELKITEAMPTQFLGSQDQAAYECFRAVMTKTTGLSLRGNALIAGEIQYINLNANGPHGTATAQIMGSERVVTSMLYGQGDIVFLNRGSEAGLQVGQLYDIYGNRLSRYKGTPVGFSPAPAGRLKIVRVSAKLATALILSAHDSVMQGDVAKAIVARPAEVEKLPQMDLTPIPAGTITPDRTGPVFDAPTE